MMPMPALGRIIHYQLTNTDADAINKRRDDFEAFQRGRNPALPGMLGASGHIAHVGSRIVPGQTFPAVVVRVFDPGHGEACVNLQVLLDGTDTYWATGVTEGDQPGTWKWPPRT